jgi:hypothetical protein
MADSAYDICKEIAEIDQRRARDAFRKDELENQLEVLTGRRYGDFMDGMRQLLAPVDDVAHDAFRQKGESQHERFGG